MATSGSRKRIKCSCNSCCYTKWVTRQTVNSHIRTYGRCNDISSDISLVESSDEKPEKHLCPCNLWKQQVHVSTTTVYHHIAAYGNHSTSRHDQPTCTETASLVEDSQEPESGTVPSWMFMHLSCVVYWFRF